MSELVDAVPAGVLNLDPRLWDDEFLPELVRDLLRRMLDDLRTVPRDGF